MTGNLPLVVSSRPKVANDRILLSGKPSSTPHTGVRETRGFMKIPDVLYLKGSCE